MPKKGSKKNQKAQDGEEEIQDTPEDTQTEESPQVPENLAERLTRIESILDVLAAKAKEDSAPKRRIPSPTIMTTRQKSACTKAAGNDKNANSQDQAGPSFTNDVQMQEINILQPAAESHPQQTPAMTSEAVGGHQQFPYVNTTLTSAAVANQQPYVNKPPIPSDFNAWLLSKAQ